MPRTSQSHFAHAQSAWNGEQTTPSPLEGEGWGEGDGCAQSRLKPLSTLPLTLTLSRKGRGDRFIRRNHE